MGISRAELLSFVLPKRQTRGVSFALPDVYTIGNFALANANARAAIRAG
jgi:hypothetical protein